MYIYTVTCSYQLYALFSQVIASCCVFTVGSLMVILMMYYCLAQLTLEDFFHLPSVILIIYAAFLTEYFFRPVRKFLNGSRKLLGDKKILWAICIGSGLLILCSTQSCITSFVLFTFSCFVSGHVFIEKNKQSNLRKNKMLDSQELEYTTVVK